MGITGREYTIGEVLNSAAYRIVVPKLQRPYSWELTELRELWTDLLAFSDAYPGKNLDGRQYFLGSVVGQLQEKEKSLELLDGQQRLATLTIWLCGIRDAFYEAGHPEIALRIHHGSIASASTDLESPDEYVLRLSSLDDKFLRQTVLAYPPDSQEIRKPKTASHAAILRAKSFIRTQLQSRAADDHVDVTVLANRLHRIITANLVVVRVASDKWDDVTDIFERLNDRGKGLSTLDLLRVYLIGRAPAPAQKDVEEAWATIYELSQSATKVDAFLRHSWITHRGDVKSRSLYKEIKGVIDAADQPAPLNSVENFSASLATDAELYKELVESNHPSDACAYWLRAISTLGATSLLPAALAGRVAMQHDDAEYELLLKRLVTTFMRWNVITGGESTELEEAVFHVARSVRAGATTSQASDSLRTYLRDDDVVESSFSKLILLRSGYQRYVLEALEDWAANPDTDFPVEKPVAGSGTLWIEHVYPQSPDAHWGRWAEHDEYLNRVGNLTLIHKKLNAGAKNGDLASKKPFYASSGLELNKYFKDRTSWSPTTIDERQSELSKSVTHIWPSF